MIIASVIAVGLREPILQCVAKWDSLICDVLALTPQQKWDAMGRFNSNFMTERWFIITGMIAIIILTVLLFVVSLHRTAQERKLTEGLFAEYADKRGLSGRECQILLYIASRAGLRRSEAIFTMSGAFDRGVAKMMEESFAGREGTKENNQLKTELSFLREKLGFKKQPLTSIGSPSQSKKLSSRQIPVGKQLHITRRKGRDTGDIESTVIENNDMEITVKLAMPIESAAGELWRARYYYGSSVWEFDTSVVSCNGEILVLNHGDNVRFINRRRFLRVPVSRPAFIAYFPFARMFSPDGNIGKAGSGVGQGSANTFGNTLKPPEFVTAIVTELAGPGLRIEAPLEVKVGERVLVVFELDEEKQPDSILPRPGGKSQMSKIVEDIGEVRHTKAIQNGFSIAVELTGLSDSNVDELIRATNAASLRTGVDGQDARGLVDSQGHIDEPAEVRGV